MSAPFHLHLNSFLGIGSHTYKCCDALIMIAAGNDAVVREYGTCSASIDPKALSVRQRWQCLPLLPGNEAAATAAVIDLCIILCWF